MTITKGTAVISVVLAGIVLLASFIYQSGLIQNLEKNKAKLLSVSTQKPKPNSEGSLNIKKIEPALSNPEGNIAIAILRGQPKPLEEAILDALENGDFEQDWNSILVQKVE